jgi:hypothetical protein
LPALVGPLANVIRSSVGWWIVGALAVLPYPLLVNRQYDVLGTLIVGQWAFVILAGAFVLTLTDAKPKPLG